MMDCDGCFVRKDFPTMYTEHLVMFSVNMLSVILVRPLFWCELDQLT